MGEKNRSKYIRGKRKEDDAGRVLFEERLALGALTDLGRHLQPSAAGRHEAGCKKPRVGNRHPSDTAGSRKKRSKI